MKKYQRKEFGGKIEKKRDGWLRFSENIIGLLLKIWLERMGRVSRGKASSRVNTWKFYWIAAEF